MSRGLHRKPPSNSDLRIFDVSKYGRSRHTILLFHSHCGHHLGSYSIILNGNSVALARCHIRERPCILPYQVSKDKYDHLKTIIAAYKHADGKKIDGRRVLVDVERGRTVKGWLPRRLGGGLGGTRRGGADVNVRHSGRDDTRRDRDGDRRRRSRSRSRDRKRRSRSRDRKRRSRSRDRKRSRSRDRKRSKRSRSRSRERRREKRERREGADAGMDGFQVKEEPADNGYNDQFGSYDYQGVNVKQEKDDGDGRVDYDIAEQGEMMEPVDRNLPMAAPGEEGNYGY